MLVVTPYLPLGLMVLWKEFVLWYYHRTMPPALRFASVLPGLGLGVMFLLMAIPGLGLGRAYEDAFIHNGLFFFFLYNGVLLMLTRNQHKVLVTEPPVIKAKRRRPGPARGARRRRDA